LVEGGGEKVGWGTAGVLVCGTGPGAGVGGGRVAEMLNPAPTVGSCSVMVWKVVAEIMFASARNSSSWVNFLAR